MACGRVRPPLLCLPLAVACQLARLGAGSTAPPQDSLVQVSHGGTHSCAVAREGGNVTCWGGGEHGQLGLGVGTGANEASLVPGLAPALAVTAGGLHTCAVESGGDVLCWGFGGHGQLGHGGLSRRGAPELVPRLGGPAANVSAGGSHTCALLVDGSVECWGWGEHGQLGSGTATSSRHPAAVALPGPALAVSAGGLHSCAVEAAGGAVWCWGWGAAWRPDAEANSAASNSASPVQVAGIQDAVDVACGYQHTCALDRHGVAMCWGEVVQRQSQEEREMWDKLRRKDMLLQEAVVNSFWPSPFGSAW